MEQHKSASKGKISLDSFIDQLRFHSHQAAEIEVVDAAANDPYAKLLKSYVTLTAKDSHITVDKIARNIHLAQFSRDYDALVQEAAKEDSTIRIEMTRGHVGKAKRKETIATDYMIRRTKGIVNMKDDDYRLRTARKRFHGVLSETRFLNTMEDMFGIGIFAFLVGSRASSFRGTKQIERYAVIETFQNYFPEFQDVCSHMEDHFLRPVISRGIAGAVVVEKAEKSSSLNNLQHYGFLKNGDRA